MNGTHRSEGILQLFFFGQWGSVCGRSFSTVDADAACIALGYTRSRSHNFVSRYIFFVLTCGGKICRYISMYIYMCGLDMCKIQMPFVESNPCH